MNTKKSPQYTTMLLVVLLSSLTTMTHGSFFESLKGISVGFKPAAMSVLVHQGRTSFNSQFSFEHKQDSLSRFLCCVPSALFYAEALKIGSSLFDTKELSLTQELALRTGTLAATLLYAHTKKPFFTAQQEIQGYLLPTSKPPVENSVLELSITESTSCFFCYEGLLNNQDQNKQILMQLPLCYCTIASFAHKSCYTTHCQEVTHQGKLCTKCKSEYYFPPQKTRHQLENGQWLLNY